MSINGVSVTKFFHAYCPLTVKSSCSTEPSLDNLELPSDNVLPSSSGAPTKMLLSVMHTPRPKSSFAVTLSPIRLPSNTNLVLYIVAVNAPPEPVLRSTNPVSCKSNVVSPESNLISRELANLSAPITTLVPSWVISRLVPNFMLLSLPAVNVCCNV